MLEPSENIVRMHINPTCRFCESSSPFLSFPSTLYLILFHIIISFSSHFYLYRSLFYQIPFFVKAAADTPPPPPRISQYTLMQSIRIACAGIWYLSYSSIYVIDPLLGVANFVLLIRFFFSSPSLFFSFSSLLLFLCCWRGGGGGHCKCPHFLKHHRM